MTNQEMTGESLYKHLEKRHRATNGIGIPIVLAYFIYTMTGGVGALADNLLVLIFVALASTFWIVTAILIHERYNKRVLADAMTFLDEPRRKSEESAVDYNERARKAITCLLNFPIFGAGYSLLTWPITITLILFSVHFLFFRFPYDLVAVMILGAINGGILVAVFQFYLFKQGVQSFLKIVLKASPNYWKEERYFGVKLGLRKKMLVSYGLLILVMMVIFSVFLFFDVIKMTQTQWAKMQQQLIERELVEHGDALIAESDAEGRQSIINEMNITPTEGLIYLIDSNGVSLLPDKSPEDEDENVRKARKEIFQRIAGKRKGSNLKWWSKDKDGKEIGKDITIMSLMPNSKNIAMDLEPKNMFINLWVHVPRPDNKSEPDSEDYFESDSEDYSESDSEVYTEPDPENSSMPNSDWIIVSRRSFRSFLPEMKRVIFTSIALVIFGLLVSIVFTHYASRDVTNPVDELVSEIEKVSYGELTQELNLITYDEVGVLSVNLKKMVENLRSMIIQIIEASTQVEGATGRIVDGFKRVSDGSRAQSGAVDETSAAMDEMNASIKGIGENVETLASTAQESSASIIEMSATIEEVADNVENLTGSIEETTSSIAEMAASVRQVAENVESLSQKAEGTVASITQMEVSIKEVQSGSEETATLSDQVTLDAETGAVKVQDTIAGISRAREDSEVAVKAIHELATKAEEIGNVLNVIDDVTDETNLLALNAAIIAAQAGEHGRGFAVVADEIKDLAERTAQSTMEISQLIEAVQNGAREAVDFVSRGHDAVHLGVKLSEEAGEALNKILESARKSTGRTRDIAKATIEQTQRTQEVLKFFEEISDNIHQVGIATREQSKGADQIQKTSEHMREIAKIVKKATQEQFIGSKQITEAMENINHIVSFINSSQQEQIKNTDQVVNAMQEIKAIASQNDEGVEEMFQASANLSNLAEELKNMVEAFKLSQHKKPT